MADFLVATGFGLCIDDAAVFVNSLSPHTILWWAALIAAILITTTSSLMAGDRLEIWPRVSLGEMLTDNLMQTSSSGGNDEISYIALGGSATVDAHDRAFDLDYATDAELYARHSREDQAFQNQYIGLRDTERLSGTTTLSLRDTFLNGQPTFAQTLIGSSAATPLLSQVLLQNNFLTNNFNAQLSHQFSGRLSMFASVGQTFFSSSSGQTSESFQQTGEFGGYYGFNARLSLGPDFQFNDFRFSNQRHADSYQPSLAGKWSWSERLATEGTIGPLIMSSAAGTIINVGYTLRSTYKGERWLFQTYSGRQPSISAGISGASVSQYEGAAAAYALSHRTTAFINGSVDQFSQTTSNGYSITYGSGIIHKLTRSISLSGQFIRYQTSSRGFGGNSSNTVILSITFAPQPWIWTF